MGGRNVTGGSKDLLVSLMVKVDTHSPNNNVVFFLSCDCRILNPHSQCTQKPFRGAHVYKTQRQLTNK